MAGRLVAEREYVAGGDRSQAAVGQANEQPPAFVHSLAAPGKFAARKPHPQLAADPGRPFEPVGANQVEAAAATPLLETPQHHTGQRREQAFGRDIGAGGARSVVGWFAGGG
jgi:hypothetical protein